ncbi:MAG TPA: hypothetical protein VNV39_08535 [Stellaceae bacterium]|jgi:hypothetical protein|nr:hypothetical protein [Stellaceae bacterium]
MRTPLYAPLDDALDEIAPYGIELKNGNSTMRRWSPRRCARWAIRRR